MKSRLIRKNFFVVLVLMVLVGLVAEAAAADPNLVGWWKFDEDEGTTAYDSAGENDGTLVGGPVWTTGQIGGALEFDGINDYVDCGNNESLQITGTEISLSAWVKWDSADNWSTIAVKASDGSWRDGYGLYAHSDNTVNFYVTQWNVNFASKSFTADGLWHHVVGTYDGSNVRIYVDAVEGTPGSYTGSISNANHSLEIGRGIYNAYNFDGLIDDVRIYDRALSAEEIWQLYRATASFQGLGRYSEAYDVSADGCVVVGWPGYWTSSGGWQSLSGEAHAVSADGSVIVGYIHSTTPPWLWYPEASRWTAEGGMQSLGLLPGREHNQSNSHGVSADGSVVVGWSVGKLGNVGGGKSEAFRWTESDGMQSIGDLPGGKFWSQATGVSADGSVVVGVGNSASGIEAFRWTESGGFQALGDLPGGGFYSCGLNVSPDGSVVIGYSKSASGIEAFRWENGVMLGLGDLLGGGFGSRAYDVSANGSVVVGMSLIGDHPSTGNVAFIWDADHGMRNLKTLLENDYGLDLTGWRLVFARGISDDGLTIVGTGHSPDYPHNYEAWVVTFPGPANVAPIACILGGNKTVEAGGGCEARVTLDGSCSSDADSTPGTNDDIVYFDWYEQIDPCDPNGEVFLGTGEIIDCNLPLGEHTIILEVIDKAGAFDANEVTIIVEDTTSPEITCPADVTVEQESYAGTVVALEAAATDNCDANPAITSDELAIYPLGVTMVTFTATDASGNSASCSMTVTVVDTIPPEFTLSISPDVLWPPNHKMVDITLTVTVGDICDPNPNVVLTSVVSNEPDDAPGGGDGQTSNDIQDAEIGTEDYNISLRAERQGKGNGRIYTITCTATDASGNSSSTSTTVTVPHDKD